MTRQLGKQKLRSRLLATGLLALSLLGGIGAANWVNAVQSRAANAQQNTMPAPSDAAVRVAAR